MTESSRRAIVAGGSIGGLFAAAALQREGWEVSVYERSDVELSGRGAGIVTHKELIEALLWVGADISDLGVNVTNRIALDQSGAVVKTFEYQQVVTSWDRIHSILRALVPDTHHHLGRSVTGYDQEADHVVAHLSDGARATAEVLIGADGFRSAIRAQMRPEVQPAYSGYVVWRTVADEASLPRAAHDLLFGEFVFYAPHGSQVVGYPIAGPDNDLRPGYRRYNFVWYSQVSDAGLRDMLTDATGKTHTVSIPPPLVRNEVVAAMKQTARKSLPAPLLDMLEGSERPFFTPIYDHCAPDFADGRVALSGDAACVARPHVGMGVTKAAQDALALARHLSQVAPDSALRAYSEERVPASRRAYDMAQRLGGYMIEGDPADNPDGRTNPRIAQIMRDTAVPVDR